MRNKYKLLHPSSSSQHFKCKTYYILPCVQKKPHLQWKMNILWRNLHTLSCKFPFPTLPYSPSASNQMPTFGPWSCLFVVHQWSRLPEKGLLIRAYSCEIYNRHNLKWKSSVCSIYPGSLQSVAALWIKNWFKNKSYTDHWEFVSETGGASSVLVDLWNCSITLQCAAPHALAVCAEPSLFTGTEFGSYALCVMVWSSGTRCGNGTQTPFAQTRPQINFPILILSKLSLFKAENLSPPIGAVPDLWLTLQFFLKI